MVNEMTPMMRQYLQIKEQNKDCILFFRLGDFYEMFFEDAENVSKELDLVLTGKDCGLSERAPMCGIPFHAADAYVSKLISKGYKVAICEQIEDPATAKGLVQRDVIRIITPGTVIEDDMLSSDKNNYILSLYVSKNMVGVSYCDVSTGSFFVEELETTISIDKITDEICRINPTEILIDSSIYEIETLKDYISANYYFQKYSDSYYSLKNAEERLLRHFHVSSLAGFGCNSMAAGICAAGALMSYLENTQRNSLAHISKISVVNRSSFMILDSSTRRNLELTVPLRTDGSRKNTLYYLLNQTKTAMGGRLLNTWINCPLQSATEIIKRQDAVSSFYKTPYLRDNVRDKLSRVSDMERLCSKIVYSTINARDCNSLVRTLETIPELKLFLQNSESEAIKMIVDNLDPLTDICTLLRSAICDDPPALIRDGGFIRTGYNKEVDDLRSISTNSQQWLASFEQAERNNTGIKKLKVGYNRVFGYYIEVTKSSVEQVPDNYIRKQTLANAERYVTPELKEMEDRILGAEDKLLKLELQLFEAIRENLLNYTVQLQMNSNLIAELDCFQSLACIAYENGYTRPTITEDNKIHIELGRHPIVERNLKEGFVPNDTFLDDVDCRLLIITGPNMAGKSTYMRQVALIVLMAHIGAYVPASAADICIVDRIFTRIGASDDLATGQSTFMVEMSEMANILNNATSKSLLILDEIGRGTSTYDGLSIAWAILEYISDSNKCGAKTLFSTHYHELTELEGKLDGVVNYRITVKEMGEDILFLRKIVRGSGDKSFGIQVARLAGLPEAVLKRAHNILFDLESSDIAKKKKKNQMNDAQEHCKSFQGSLFDTDKESTMLRILEEIDPDSISPREALDKLYILKNLAKKDVD